MATALLDLTLSSVGSKFSVFWCSLCSVPYMLDWVLRLTGRSSSLSFCFVCVKGLRDVRFVNVFGWTLC